MADMNDERALIFSNLLNGVTIEQVARDLRKSESEVTQAFSFVLRKIKSYCFERKMPSILATTVAEAHKHRMVCLSILPKLNLEKPPRFANIINEMVTTDNAMTITRELRP